MSRIRAAFRAQGIACGELGSPFMARLMPLIGTRLEQNTPVGERILNWQGDPSPAGHSVPLRLAGALHALRLEGVALTDVYPPNDVSDDALWQAVHAALSDHEASLMAWLDSPPQTNEVRRSAVLLPVLAMIASRHDAPVELYELGASGGLNLAADRFWLAPCALGKQGSSVQLTPEWRGDMPGGKMPKIISRQGVDLNPLDPSKEADQLRLRAYLWPDQDHRITRTEAAIEVAKGLKMSLDAEDAGAWLEQVLARPANGAVRLVYHTVAWQYFPDETKAQARRAMERSTIPLYHFGMETDGQPNGAALTLTIYPAGETISLGRADFHGRWVDWQG